MRLHSPGHSPPRRVVVAVTCAAVVTAALALGGCTLPLRQEQTAAPSRAATATSAADVGGLAKLIDLAKREGTLTLAAAPSGWSTALPEAAAPKAAAPKDAAPEATSGPAMPSPLDAGQAAVVRGFQARYGLAVRHVTAAYDADGSSGGPGPTTTTSASTTTTTGPTTTSPITGPTTTGPTTTGPTTTGPTTTGPTTTGPTTTSPTTTSPTTTSPTTNLTTTSPTTGAGATTTAAADVVQLDLAAAQAVAATPGGRYAAYEVAVADSVAEPLRSGERLWVGDYSAAVAVGYDPRQVPAPQAWSDLGLPPYRGVVALAGDPAATPEGMAALATAALVHDGTLPDVTPGIAYFAGLRRAGTLVTAAATPAAVTDERLGVLIGLETTQRSLQAELGSQRWRVLMLPGPVVHLGRALAVTADAQHPAAARLFLEYSLSDEAQNLRLQAGVRPSRLAAMVAEGTQAKDAYAALPLPAGDPVFLTAAQQDAVRGSAARSWATVMEAGQGQG